VEKDDLAVSACAILKRLHANGSSEQQVSHDRPGKCDIKTEFRHFNNNRFILHDSEGFEPGQDAKFNAVKRFIEERTRSEIPPQDRLHLVW
jgi:hypothetical protein